MAFIHSIAEKARAGESAAYAAADLTVEELRQRQEQIKLQLWASRVAVEEARLALYDAQDTLSRHDHAEAERHLEEIRPAFEKLKARFEEAQRLANRDPVPYHQTTLKKTAKDRLKELESSYPGA